MKKVLSVFGTRPEAIKMCPVINELEKNPNFDSVVCVTGQHQQMLEQVLKAFNTTPKYNLAIMQNNQTLFDITISILKRMQNILRIEHPDIVLVHGDTTTAFATALACFYLQIPVGHVEAGLRTHNINSPFPEEFNRQTIDIISQFYFTPTEASKKNLIDEGKAAKTVFVTGNTGIDALNTTIEKDYYSSDLEWAKDSRLIMVTAHRRENLGPPMRRMFKAIKRVLDENPDIKAIFPIHMNPRVRSIANEAFGYDDKIRIIEPLGVIDFHNYLKASYLILTDSGGIQEEAPSLGKPVLVMRNATERPEGVAAGTLKLVGTNEDSIYENFTLLLNNPKVYKQMSLASNPYGDGKASKRIVKILEEKL